MMDFSTEIEKIKNQLIENYKPEKIILFGSVARKEANEDSDIDLLLIKNTEKKFTERIREAHKGLTYRIPLDLLVYTQDEIQKLKSSNLFIQEILEEGIVIYEH